MSSVKYRSEIDGLRAVAVVPVILFHAHVPGFSGGFVGVDVFFVISGYLITTIIADDRDKGQFSLLAFYERRARRILPALLVVLACCVAAAALLLLPGYWPEFSESIFAVTVFASNIFFWHAVGYFATPAASQPLLHTWTLAVEEQFYIFFPLLLGLLWKLGRQWLLPALIAMAFVGLALGEWGALYHLQADFYLAPFRAWELITGAICALYLRRPNVRRSNPWLALIGLGMILLSVVAFDKDVPAASVYGLLPVGGSALVIAFAGPGTVAARLLSLRPLVGIGLISYSAYLWHQPLLAFASISDLSGWPVAVGAVVASLGLAFLSWKYVEVPFRNRRNISLRQLMLFVGVLTATVNGVALAAIATDGFIARYAPEDRQLAGINALDEGRYVQARLEERILAPFRQDGRKKVLVIGDSFGQDLVNALFEAGAGGRIQVSTFHISFLCGNLMLDRDFSAEIPPALRADCHRAGGYGNPALRKLIGQADVIWLASAWLDWQVRLLPQSIANIRRITQAKIVVLARKDFGTFTIRELLRLPAPQRWTTKLPIQAKVAAVLATSRKEIPPDELIDSVALLCGSKAMCPLFTADRQLISFDGSHLTQAGARFFGERILADPLVADILKERH